MQLTENLKYTHMHIQSKFKFYLRKPMITTTFCGINTDIIF